MFTRAMQWTYVVFAWLILAAVTVQFFLAGLGVFAGASNFEAHRMLGYIKSANQSLISHELVRHIVNETLGNTLEASGQIFSNTIEHGLNRPPKK